MTRTRRPLFFLGVIAVSALLFAGCKATGGGYIESAYDPDKKANFGFVWQTTEDPEKFLVKGQWSDGPVKFKLDEGAIFTRTNGDDGCGIGIAQYTSTSKTYPGSGELQIALCDFGEPGPTNGDALEIRVLSGPYSGYTNYGELQGGNLQIKQ